MASPTESRVLSIKPLDNKDARWINLVQIEYKGPDGKLRTWEAMQRTTRPKDSPVDAVHILAIRDIIGGLGPEVLLEKQFRPPAGSVVVEFPAGLIDAGETVEECAVRELREETGYIGEVIPDPSRPILFGSPASSASRTVMINVTIDLGKPENQTPKAELEVDEFIEPFWVPLKSLHEGLRTFIDQGFAIDGKVGIFAEGIEAAKRWPLV
ncbi:NUDIX hydrolase domain-like protein [Podospora didyma]|uniref:NUDIX hydrolase domain-like protein n=1 Tax=Podospora didyma TaxID=330526 RepID=A0AAE0NG35_9PEZI|nr:NUDIX hydrolase domain-like protein [Podospora didyma]